MKTLSRKPSALMRTSPDLSFLDKLARTIVRKRLRAILEGQIVINESGRHEAFGRLTDEFPLTAYVKVENPRFYSEVAFGGAIGAGEAYIQGYWSCEELTNLVRILLRNRHVLEGLNRGLAALSKPIQKTLHWLNRNTRSGSRRNISAHYDLGNRFYALWLDRRMMYSSAVFERSDMTLDEASETKLDRICRKLRLKPSDHVLEIGTGWGGFAHWAATNYGCRVTTTTLSERQHEYASDAIKVAGLEDRITLLRTDYRDLTGEFDKLVSIEMIEAIGWQYQDTYFSKCANLLKPQGEMLLQAITIADNHYDAYKKSVDFIRQYVFPGGCLTSVTSMLESTTRVTDLRVVHVEDIGPHYAKTLECWHDRFLDQIDVVRGLGYSEEFIRMWIYYFCYCEGAFIEHATGNVQMHMIKPQARVDVVAI